MQAVRGEALVPQRPKARTVVVEQGITGGTRQGYLPRSTQAGESSREPYIVAARVLWFGVPRGKTTLGTGYGGRAIPRSIPQRGGERSGVSPMWLDPVAHALQGTDDTRCVAPDELGAAELRPRGTGLTTNSIPVLK